MNIFLIKSITLPATVIGLGVASPSTALLGYVLLALFSLTGYQAALRALALTWLIGALNPGFAFGGEAGSIGRPSVYVATVVSVFGRELFCRRPFMSKNVLSILALGIILIVHSILFSQLPTISLLKAVVWTLVTATIFLAYYRMNYNDMEVFTKWFFVFCCTVMIISWPLVASNLGFFRNGRGFQGILNHPQTFGVFLGLLSAWSFTKIIGEREQKISHYAVLAGSVAALILSESRSGGVAFLGGTGIASILSLFYQNLNRELPGLKSVKLYLFGFLSVGILIIWSNQIGAVIVDYVTKQYSADTLAGLYETSRGFLVSRAIDAFQNNPLTGVGFGISFDMDMMVQRDPIFGLPISAPVEKGNVFTAILGEVGIVVTCMLAIWMLWLLRRAFIAGTIPLAVCCAALLVNVGEAVFFSPGGNGLLVLLFFGWSVSQYLHRRYLKPRTYSSMADAV